MLELLCSACCSCCRCGADPVLGGGCKEMMGAQERSWHTGKQCMRMNRLTMYVGL